jgi:hypothetical protein
MRERAVDLVAQVFNVNVDSIGPEIVVRGPDMIEDHGPCDDEAGMAHHEFEQLVFLTTKLNELAATFNLTGCRIELEFTDNQRTGNGTLTMAYQDTKAGFEFFEVKGFG